MRAAELQIIRDLANAHVDPSEAGLAIEQLTEYLTEILSWSRDSNLVSRGDLDRLAERHLRESAAVIPLLDRLGPAHLLDVGSGAGFPGIPIKILRPSIRLTLVESRRRKGLFLQRVIDRLGLNATHVLIQRIERVVLEDEPPVDVATARAVATLGSVLGWLAPIVRMGGQAVLFKGSSHAEELEKWRSGGASDGSSAWSFRETVPIAEEDLHLVLLVFDRT